MRNLRDPEVHRFRDVSPSVFKHFGSYGDETCGAFWVASPIDGSQMRVIASNGEGWAHVSVSRKNRCPNWPEFEFVRKLFFAPSECAMQLHVPADDHVNCNPHCLHLWRPHNEEIPRPPRWMVGPTEDD